MPDQDVRFYPLPWPPSDPCACGNPATWEMFLQDERVPLCSECYQIETLHRSPSPGSLLCDRIHHHWLVYPSENPVRIRSDGIT